MLVQRPLILCCCFSWRLDTQGPHQTFSFITRGLCLAILVFPRWDSKLYWLLKLKLLPRIDEKNEVGFKVPSWEIRTTLGLNFTCIPLWKKHSDGILDIFCIIKEQILAKQTWEIQAEGVVLPSGTSNACCTSKIHLSCTHRPTEIKAQSRDWELLPISSLQLTKTAPSKMTANARKRWGWLQSGMGEVRLLQVRRFQEAEKRHLSDNWVAWAIITTLRFLLQKKKNLMNWNLIAIQDQSGFPSHIQISQTNYGHIFIYLSVLLTLVDWYRKKPPEY